MRGGEHSRPSGTFGSPPARARRLDKRVLSGLYRKRAPTPCKDRHLPRRGLPVRSIAVRCYKKAPSPRHRAAASIPALRVASRLSVAPPAILRFVAGSGRAEVFFQLSGVAVVATDQFEVSFGPLEICKTRAMLRTASGRKNAPGRFS